MDNFLKQGIQCTGLTSTYREINPNKKPLSEWLTVDQITKNQKISSKRVLIKIVLTDCVCLLCLDPLGVGKNTDITHFTFCVVLTTAYVTWNPLRRSDCALLNSIKK